MSGTYTVFRMNIPHPSHMGGTWERLIQSVRNVLEPLLLKAESQLNDETLQTFMTEVVRMLCQLKTSQCRLHM